MIHLVGDVRFALCDRSLHRVEGRGQTSELVPSRSLDRDLITALLDAVSGFHELTDRTSGAPSEQCADDSGERKRDTVDREQCVTDVPVGREYGLHRLLQGQIDRIAARIQPLRDTEEFRASNRQHSRSAAASPCRHGATCWGKPLRSRQCRGDMFRAVPAVRHQGDVRADEVSQSLRERVIHDETHRDPRDCLGSAHRRQKELVRAICEDCEVRLIACELGLIEQAGQGGAGARTCVGRGDDYASMSIQEQNHVRANALSVVLGRRENGRGIGACHRLPESEIAGEHGDRIGELSGTETDQLLNERCAGTQLLGRARFDVVSRARQHCGQRHSLSDDDQSDDQYEKPFAETTHETDSNARIGHRRRRAARAARIRLQE